ncbi:MAG: T9SS type A sorting domain-containing protein [Fluviicola sp.]
MKKLGLLTIMSFIFGWSFSQCLPGEVEVTMIVHTDDYGYEGYWQLIPSGNSCGTGTIDEGGNAAVGCNGAGAQNQTPGGYGDNQQINEGPWCLVEGAQYDLVYTDDWGDGGFSFDIIVNGYQVYTFDGVGLGATFTFTAQEPPAYDLSVFNSNLYNYVEVGNYNLEAQVFNGGTTTITSYDLNYTVNGGAVSTHNVVGTNLTNYSSEHVDHSIPINIPANGLYTVKIWSDNLNNGSADLNNGNDTLTVIIEAGPGIPNYLDGYIGSAVTVTQIAGAGNSVNDPTDLDFHPVLTNKELWVINRGTENSGGSTVTIFNAGEPGQTSTYKQDGNAWHFMSLPTGLAFSRNGNWASSPGVYDANHNGGDAFTGPSLWSSDMNIYAEPSGGNGSHLDMLHLSPYSQGIASEEDNVFWVTDGYTNDIVRYDFVEDHGPGNSFHGDAIVHRFSDDAITKDPNNTIVSHLVLDKDKKWLYVVDHGGQRVFRIDITTGSDQGGAPNYPENEPVSEYAEYTGYTQELVVSGLDKPAGIDVIEDRLIVSEYQTGEIIIYDISTLPATELERISTGLNSVQGIKIGPEGKIWFVDGSTDGVYRLETSNLGVGELALDINVYPNPNNGSFIVQTDYLVEGVIQVRDVNGKLMEEFETKGTSSQLNLQVEAGIYFVSISTEKGSSSIKKICVK